MINSRALDTGFKTVQIDITTEKDFLTVLRLLRDLKDDMESVAHYSFEQRCAVSDLVRELGHYTNEK
jgi:hypothetical protein